jgi:hypothetical protein
MPRTIIQQLTLCKTGIFGIISQLLCDVCDLLAIGLESSGVPGTTLRGAKTPDMPNSGMYPPPAAPVRARLIRESLTDVGV